VTVRPGDVLLYRPTGLYGWFIRVKTWHPIGHVEIAMGNGLSTASRDKQGVNYYPTRTSDLAYVLRPAVAFDLEAAQRYVSTMIGMPYGWWDLANFVGIPVDSKGIVCSPYATLVLRAGTVPIFAREAANLIAPFQFLDSELLIDVTADVLQERAA